jgi:hypothetical protein
MNENILASEIENLTPRHESDSDMWDALKEERDRVRHNRSAKTYSMIKTYNKQNKDEWTYLIFDGQKYKVGRSKDPEERLKGLKTANPSCQLVMKTKKISEKLIHTIYREKRLDREWFYFDDNDLFRLKELFESNADVGHNNLVLHHFRRYRKERQAADYVITFGMFRGTKITDMVDTRQIDYVNWYLTNDFCISDKTRNPYLAFRWWSEMLKKMEEPKEGSMESLIESFKERSEMKKSFKKYEK